MRLLEIEKKARTLGINETSIYSKKELIRGIQRKEANKECFATRTRSVCGQMNCCWRNDCV